MSQQTLGERDVDVSILFAFALTLDWGIVLQMNCNANYNVKPDGWTAKYPVCHHARTYNLSCEQKHLLICS
jgi:hypothetical protein